MQRVRLRVVSAPQKPALSQGHWRKDPLIARSVVMAILLAAGVTFAEE
jgi:hypothetical protein